MKRKTAKEILAESFREIAEKKSADKITVMDVAENCGYSTTTFYRHFKDKYDLMAWEYTRGLEQIMDRVGHSEAGWKHACLECAQLFYEQRTYLMNLLQHTSGYDSFSRNMMTIHYEVLKSMIMERSDLDIMDVHLEMCVREYCHGAVDLSCDWIMEHYDVTPEELTQVFIDSLPNVLRRYLLTEE